MSSDPDFEAHGARVRVVDDAAHLEAADLSGDDTVLDHRHGPGGAITSDEREVLVGGWWRREQRLGDRREQGRAPRRARP